MNANRITCRDVFGNTYNVPIKDLTPRIGVYAIIIKDNKILLSKQWDGHSLVGGGVEPGETMDEALKREVREEAGLTIKPTKIIHYKTTFFKQDSDHPAYHSFQFYFTCKIISDNISTPKITNNEKTYTTGSPEWISLGKIDQITFRHSVKLKEILEHLN